VPAAASQLWSGAAAGVPKRDDFDDFGRVRPVVEEVMHSPEMKASQPFDSRIVGGSPCLGIGGDQVESALDLAT
jgi:hypothetical protein